MKNALNNLNSREKVDFSNLVVFTGTFYGNDETSQIRSLLALKLFDNAQKYGIKVVVVDGGSGEIFLNALKKYPNIYLIHAQTGNTMAGERRLALKTALELYADIPYFLWTEPEKDDLITPKNLSPMMKGIESGKFSIIVPKRKDKITMPDFQAREETRANKELSSLMSGTKRKLEKNADLYGGEEYDFFFGPKLFTRNSAEYMVNYKGTLDKWDGNITPVLIASAKGEKIGSVDIDYNYDLSQKNNETDNRDMERKRLSQYVSILDETKRQLLSLGD